MDVRSITGGRMDKRNRQKKRTQDDFMEGHWEDDGGDGMYSDMDDDDDDMFGAGGGAKKKAPTTHADDDSDGLSGDEEEATNTGTKDQSGNRDRTRYHALQLKKQGIDLEGGGIGKEDDAEFQEYIDAKGTAKGTTFQAGKEQADYVAPTREQLQNLFGKNSNDKIESFRMNSREDTHNDRGGVIEQQVSQSSVADAWLEEWDERQKKPKDDDTDINKISQRVTQRKKTDEFEGLDIPPIRKSKDKKENLSIILEHIEPKESILKALRRLGDKQDTQKQKQLQQQQRNRRKNQRTTTKSKMEDSPSSTSSTPATLTPELRTQIAMRKRAFDELTEAAQNMIEAGEFEIYSQTREGVEKVVRMMGHKERMQEAARRQASNPQSKPIHWEYKWTLEDPAKHGPFVGKEMTEWRGMGYFANESIVCRRVGPGHPPGTEDEREWVPIADVMEFEVPTPKPAAAAKSTYVPAKKRKFEF